MRSPEDKDHQAPDWRPSWISDDDFSLIRRLALSSIGLSLDESKRAMAAERVSKLLRETGYESFQEFYNDLPADVSGSRLLRFVDMITTNHTYFFREKEHLDYLIGQLVPAWLEEGEKNGRRKLRVWSAGCSSGEEPYSLAMALTECLGARLSRWDVGILATDVAVSALEKAESGRYAESQLSHVPALFRLKYFERTEDGEWQVRREVRNLIRFGRLNLMDSQFPLQGNFDAVFCRNVLIYFEEQMQEKLTSRLCRYLKPWGYLFIGHSESLGRNHPDLRYIRPAVYQKR